jgi:hypothetical protein
MSRVLLEAPQNRILPMYVRVCLRIPVRQLAEPIVRPKRLHANAASTSFLPSFNGRCLTRCQVQAQSPRVIALIDRYAEAERPPESIETPVLVKALVSPGHSSRGAQPPGLRSTASLRGRDDSEENPEALSGDAVCGITTALHARRAAVQSPLAFACTDFNFALLPQRPAPTFVCTATLVTVVYTTRATSR